jgi:hypothetical protein
VRLPKLSELPNSLTIKPEPATTHLHRTPDGPVIGIVPIQMISAKSPGNEGRQDPHARRLPADLHVQTVVKHGDRLGRMNIELVEAALSAHERGLVVLDPDEVDDDLVRDVTEVLTLLCARLYGRRSAPNWGGKAVQCTAWDIGPASPQVVR